MLIEFLTKNEVGMNENEYGNYLVFIIVSVLVSVGVITIISKLTFIHNNRFFIWLGRNTLYIIGFNYLCRDIATELYHYIPVIRKIQIHWMSAFILTFGLCLLCIVICTKTRRLFGYLFKRGQHASKKGCLISAENYICLLPFIWRKKIKTAMIIIWWCYLPKQRVLLRGFCNTFTEFTTTTDTCCMIHAREKLTYNYIRDIIKKV